MSEGERPLSIQTAGHTIIVITCQMHQHNITNVADLVCNECGYRLIES